MSDGHPNLNGIWQAVNTANWNLQDHPAYPGPMWEMGAIAAVPGGKGVVEGNEIPYKPEAAAKKKENFTNRRTRRSGSEMLYARHSPRQLHAISFSDRPNQQGHPIRIRIRQFEPPGEYGQARRKRAPIPGWARITATGKATRW